MGKYLFIILSLLSTTVMARELMIESSFQDSSYTLEKLFSKGDLDPICSLRLNFTTGFVSVTYLANDRSEFKGCGFFLDTKVYQEVDTLTFQGENARTIGNECLIVVKMGTNRDGRKNHPISARLLQRKGNSGNFIQELNCDSLIRRSNPNYF